MRKFFYGAIAANVNHEVRKLKNIEAPPLIRHEAVKTAITDLISGNDDIDSILQSAKEFVEKSISDPYDIEKEQAITEHCIASFFNIMLDDVMTSNHQLIKETEPISFIYEDIVIMTQPELIIHEDHHVEILSFRTGPSAFRDSTETDLKTYALTAWANSALTIDKKVIVSDIYLREDCAKYSESLDESEMSRLYSKARETSFRYSSSAKVSDFPSSPGPDSCRFCLYKEICKEYYEFFEESYDLAHIDDVLSKLKHIEMEKKSFFISHSSLDKDKFVRPLVQKLNEEGITYWYDGNEIAWGDSLIEEINKGLLISDYLIVCFSDNYFNAKWADKELRSKIMQQFEENKKVILPLMLGNSKELRKKAPLISDLKYIDWEIGLDGIITNLKARIDKDS